MCGVQTQRFPIPDRLRSLITHAHYREKIIYQRRAAAALENDCGNPSFAWELSAVYYVNFSIELLHCTVEYLL